MPLPRRSTQRFGVRAYHNTGLSTLRMPDGFLIGGGPTKALKSSKSCIFSGPALGARAVARTAKSLLLELQQRRPGRYPNGQSRTLQRRVREWRRQILETFDGEWLELDRVRPASASAGDGGKNSPV